MLIDTHCHINILAKQTFDSLMTNDEIIHVKNIIEQAAHDDVTCIINVGTSLIESINCITLATTYPTIFASIGIHPTDCTSTWRDDVQQLHALLRSDIHKRIVAIGETGLDRYHEGYDIQRQKDAFKAQINLALEHDLALIVHTRQAPDETLYILEEFKGQITRGVIHCFSEDQFFADTALDFGYVLGIGGTITYPKNNILREVVTTIPLEKIVLETDTPFLPPQIIRGKKNHPKYIATIAHYLAQLRQIPFEQVAAQTTANARRLFNL